MTPVTLLQRVEEKNPTRMSKLYRQDAHTACHEPEGTAGETPALQGPPSPRVMTTGNSTSGLDISKGSGTARVTAPAPLWATVIATFFGVGRLRPGPGSWGSAATVLLWAIVTRWIPPNWQPWAAFLLAGLAVLAGIPAASRVARATAL